MFNKQISPSHKSSAALWDLDGTLIDTNQYHWQAWQEELSTRGRVLGREEFSASFGQRNDTILRLWINPEISVDEIQRISDSKEERYRRLLLANGLQLLPGAAYWLAELRAAGWRQALATMTGRENIAAIFSILPIEPFFAAVVTGDEVSSGKPDPEIFLEAARKVNVQPGNCVVIEDAPAGVEAARRAGMKSIGINSQKKLLADWNEQSLDLLPPGIFQSLLDKET